MKEIWSDTKIILIVLVCTLLYPFFMTGKINITDTIILLLIITFSICLCSVIITYYSNRKYLSILYKYLSVSFLGIGIASLSYINIIESTFLKADFWINATGFNTIFSIYESVLLIFSFKNIDKRINIKLFLMITIVTSLIISLGGINYVSIIEYIFGYRYLEMIRFISRVIALFFKINLLVIVILNKSSLSKRVYNNFIAFSILRILLHSYGFINRSLINMGVIYICCLLIAIANYCIVKIMILEIMRNPQEILYKNLVENTIKLENIIRELKEANNQKDIIKSDYEKKTKEDKIKNELLTNISHEFKTPVNVIYAAVQTQESKKDVKDIEELKKYNGIIKQNCYRMIRLVNNFIDIVKFEERQIKLRLKCENIVCLTEQIVMSAIPFANSKKLNIIFDTSDEELYCIIDPHLYERVILNILSNSIKYTNVSSDINVSLFSKDGWIEIVIEDHGIGISKESLNTIFDRFERVDKTFSRDTEGIGLGLNIVKEIIDMHKGKVEILSEKGKGTKVIVKLHEFRKEKSSYYYDNGLDDNLIEQIQHETDIEMSDIYFT